MRTAEDIVKQKDGGMICVSPDTSIREALQMMVDNKFGAILIKEDDRVVGIWTERDLMRNSLLEGFDPAEAKIVDYMTTGLVSAPHTDSAYQLLDKFLGKRLRHLLIEKDGDYIGLISVGDVVKASLMDKSDELEKLNTIVNWDYYENWKWKKK